ncbi:MAG: hypothetical protein ACREVK_12310 [Gammaproteobacteria bacterium]
MSRDKGARSERELGALLSGELGNIVQKRVGEPVEGEREVEVKRSERFLFAYWQQTVSQAEATRRRPVLFWRKSRQAWTAFVDLADLAPERFPMPGREVARISIPAWAQLVRELA